MFLAFKNGVKSIQTAGYNGTRTVDYIKKYSATFPYVKSSDESDRWYGLADTGIYI